MCTPSALITETAEYGVCPFHFLGKSDRKGKMIDKQLLVNVNVLSFKVFFCCSKPRKDQSGKGSVQFIA